jgi:hypothetical protein
MRIGELDELMGQYCRVISKVPEVEETFYDFGTVKYVNTENGFILLETKRGLKHFKIEDIYDALPIDDYISKKFDD